MSADWELGSIAKALHERNKIESRRNELLDRQASAIAEIAKAIPSVAAALQEQANATAAVNVTFEAIGGLLAEQLGAEPEAEAPAGPATLGGEEIDPMTADDDGLIHASDLGWEIERHARKQDVSYADAWSYFRANGYDMTGAEEYEFDSTNPNESTGDV